MTLASSLEAPDLVLRLPGEWIQFVPHDPDGRAKLRAYVEGSVGTGDELARQRALLTERLRDSLDVLDRGTARALFLCVRVSPRLPLPMVLTVFPSASVRIAPALGSAPGAVIHALRRALVEAGEAAEPELVELTTPETVVLRCVRRREARSDPRGPAIVRHDLSADYWFAAPGSKNVAWMSAFTPFGEASVPMTAFLDSIARLARFAPSPAARPSLTAVTSDDH